MALGKRPRRSETDGAGRIHKQDPGDDWRAPLANVNSSVKSVQQLGPVRFMGRLVKKLVLVAALSLYLANCYMGMILPLITLRK